MPRMTKTTLVAFTVALALGSGAAVVHADALKVRPVASPEAIARSGGRLRADALTPAEQQVLARRLEIQKQGEALERQVMFPPGLVVDRTRFAARRPGWTPPPGVTRDASELRGWRVDPQAARLGPPDTIRVAFLRVDFLHDRGGSASTGDGKFDLSGPDTNVVPIDRAPHNRDFYESHARALERFYDVQSYGRVVLQIDTWPAEQDSAYHLNDMADLGPWKFGNSVYRAAVNMFRDMFFAADTQSTQRGDRIPWQKYDRFMVIHAGGDLQSDVRQDSKEDIPSFTVFLGDTDRVIFRDSLAWNVDNPIDRASFVPETVNQDGYYGALNGVIAHENGHNIFGFLDVYDIESGYPVCGYWSLMDSGNLDGVHVALKDGDVIWAIGLLPPSIDPFQRNFIGDGMDIRVPTWGDTLAIRGSNRGNVFYKLPLSSDEYVLLENRYQWPGDTLVDLEADPVTKVILGPRSPDRFEYDALGPGSGILAWHVDESVVPFERSLRINPDYGLNTNWARQGLQIIEADGLDDLGDGGSPYLEGSPLDPYQKSVNASLSDSTTPNLLPNQGTRPHLRVDFLDDAGDTMHFTASRTWAMRAFPVRANLTRGGAWPLAIDADGDRNFDVCWAGGDTLIAWPDKADSNALFAVRPDGTGLAGGPYAFAHLDAPPFPQMAACLTGDASLGEGPAVFAACTRDTGAGDPHGGKVWLVDHHGAPLAGWPVTLPAFASTPPVIAGTWPNIAVLVGAKDGYVYALDATGAQVARSATALAGGVSGRLAFWQGPGVLTVSTAAPSETSFVAAGGANGEVAVYRFSGAAPMARLAGWNTGVAGAFVPDFLWLHLGGEGTYAEGNCASGPTLVAHHADKLWAWCLDGGLLRGWGRSLGDTLVAGLGVGDPDGDGFPEVLTQTRRSKVMFVNRDGYPSPGWPRAGSKEEFLASASPALALDVDADDRSEVVTLNGSGMLVALRADGHAPVGWPLATGAGAAGSLVAADLDRDGTLELVAPDRDTLLYAYRLPVGAGRPGTMWTMAGGDPGRTYALPSTRGPQPVRASAGPLVAGTLKAFPNPARRRPVSFAYSLSEDARVDVKILDTSGHEVASFQRQGLRAENTEVWDPGALPAGLYVAHLTFSGAHGSASKVLTIGVLR